MYKIGLFCAFLFLAASFFSCSSKPDDASLLVYIRAQGLYAEGRYSETSALLNARGRLRGFLPALALRGKALYFTGDIESARKVFAKIIRKQPAHTESLLYMARIYRERNEDAKAARIVENLLANDPFNVRALRLAAQLAEDGAAGLQVSGKDTTTALAYLNRAADSAGEYSLALLDRARLCWREGRRADALDDLRGARALVPQQSPLYKSIENLEGVIAKAKKNDNIIFEPQGGNQNE